MIAVDESLYPLDDVISTTTRASHYALRETKSRQNHRRNSTSIIEIESSSDDDSLVEPKVPVYFFFFSFATTGFYFHENHLLTSCPFLYFLPPVSATLRKRLSQQVKISMDRLSLKRFASLLGKRFISATA